MTLDDEDTNSTDEANGIDYDTDTSQVPQPLLLVTYKSVGEPDYTDTDDHGDDFGSENDNGDEDESFYGKSVGGNVRNEAAKLDSATREDETDIMMMTINDENMLMMMMLIQGGFF